MSVSHLQLCFRWISYTCKIQQYQLISIINTFVLEIIRYSGKNQYRKYLAEFYDVEKSSRFDSGIETRFRMYFR